jgi:hypothetical protein
MFFSISGNIIPILPENTRRVLYCSSREMRKTLLDSLPLLVFLVGGRRASRLDEGRTFPLLAGRVSGYKWLERGIKDYELM